MTVTRPKDEGQRPNASGPNAEGRRPNASEAETVVREILGAAIRAHQTVRDGDLAAVAKAARVIGDALKSGRKVLAFGNGGSAADAQHFAAELVGRFERQRRGAAAIALTTDTSVLTAVGNDYGFEHVFARQVEALGVEGDVAVGISTSGQSANVVKALDTARARRMVTIALTGRNGGPVAGLAAVHVNVPERSAARVQEVHRTLLHAICELVEREL